MDSRDRRDAICNVVWKACDTFRGAIDPTQYKDYILTMLFVKYLSDLAKDKRTEFETKYNGDEARVERALSRERFVMPPCSDYDYLYEKRDEANIGEIIDQTLEKIEDANKGKLDNVFRGISFNSENLGQTKDRNARLKYVLEDFHDPILDLRPSTIGNRDIIGDVYEYLIGRFASDAGKKAGEFYTPPEVSTLLAKLLQAKSGDKICDPTCGSGSLLIKVAKEIADNNFFIAGQESNGSTWALAKMNMYLHEMDGARIEWCDTIKSPRLIEGDRLMKFNIVVANPPFSLDKWGSDNPENDQYNRFWRGIPPKSKGDYAFISHMIEIAIEGDGKVGVVVPHGVLFRSGTEGLIRQKLIDENLLEAVIGLPANLFYGTGIPAAILIFNKGKTTTDVLFIDASREYEDAKNQRHLRDQDIEKIVSIFKKSETLDRYSYRASIEDIQEAKYNLNIARYVDVFEEEEEVDIAAVQKEITSIEAELATTRAEMSKYLDELGLLEMGG